MRAYEEREDFIAMSEMEASPTKDRLESAPGFLDEFKSLTAQVPQKGLFFALLVPWVLFFQFLGSSTFGYIDTHSLFHWMYNAYNSDLSEDGHGNLIPFVVLGLLWWKRDELMAVQARNWWPALALVAFALMLHMLGFMVQQTRISIVAFFVGLYGIMGMVWGPQLLRASFFPYFLFAFCVPLGNSAEYITFPLRMLVTTLSVGIGHHVLGIQVIQDGSRIFDAAGTFQYDVAPACSGIRSLIALLSLMTVYGFIAFRKNWKRVLMIALAFPLAVAGNTVRITGVIVAGEAFGQEAGAWIEQKLGFVTFLVAIVTVMAVGHWLEEENPPACATNSNHPEPQRAVEPDAQKVQ
jgi:exosortase